ncbi:topoisomerase [Gluconacetobacter asukensis]|uniref:Topoisomerase n=1 Tax=Gluconacetobacter asukensis TaxID=1017181 RepID=A0A7W4NZD8_9PROT|nr:topoisomerase [Gluconacetobacter asukensis]MBB2171777.1 topoisomerase [Gluconacetobacter asukensis]
MTGTAGIPFDAINAAALANWPSLVAGWLPAGRRRGDEWVVGGLDNAPGRSLSINLRTGRWADFADGPRGGDPISLYAALHARDDRVRAARELGALLGVGDGAAAAVRGAPDEEDWRPAVPPPGAPMPDLDGWDHVYAYRDAAGRVMRYVVRRDATAHARKRIMPLTWGTVRAEGGERTGWHPRHAAVPRSLYGLERVMRARTVLVCEGEKAADAAQCLFPRMACVTWTAGSGHVSRADWSVLAGRHVILWPDHDAPGAKAVAEIAAILGGIAATVRLVDVGDLEPGDDAADLRVPDARAWLCERVGPVLCGTSVKRAGTRGGPAVARRVAGLEPIAVRGGEIDLVASAGERALVAANAPVYQRGTRLARPGRREVAAADGRLTQAACLMDIGVPALTDLLCQVVEWRRFDRRSQGWKAIDPPAAAAQVILSRAGTWPFAVLAGVITTPTLRPDGSVLMAPGHDAATRLYHVDDPTLELSLPEPTRAAAEDGLARLEGLLAEFPFAAEADRSVALAAILTTVVRGMMPVSPLFAFRANAPGSGKSFLVDLASVIATGRVCPVTSAGEDVAEMEKRLTGLLLAGYPIMSLDNVNEELGGDLLCQATERPILRLRELGASSSVEIENRAVIFATGNALRVRGDMTRRALLATLDAGIEQPELRRFARDPVADIMADRGAYVSACLTILRAWMGSGAEVDLPPLASFEGWSRTVRAALVWLGRADPCLSMQAAREDDPERGELREMLGLLAEAAGVGRHCGRTVREIEDLSALERQDSAGYRDGMRHPELRDALLRIAGTPAGRVNSRRLGRWFLARRGRVIDGLRIVECGMAHGGVKRWAVERV